MSGTPEFGSVTVVLVTHNSSAILQTTAPALRLLRHLVVVDNASEDDTPAVIARLLPQARLHCSRRNLGFGGANNVALERIDTPFALLLNPDCHFNATALQTLLEAAVRYPEAAILAPVLHDSRNKAETAYNLPFYLRPKRSAYVDPVGDLCTDFLTGAALLLRMAALRQTGFFDPAIFMYYEDDDLGLRVRSAGHSLVLVPSARMEHLVGRSSRRTARLLFRKYFHETASRLYVWNKYRGRQVAIVMAARLAGINLLKLPLFLIACNREMIVRSVARTAAAIRSLFRIRPLR